MEQTENSATKICPFCGEEILATAIKCKHCGEFLTEEGMVKLEEQLIKQKALELGVDEKWIPLFDLVERYYVEGNWWKQSPAWKELKFMEKSAVSSTIAGCDAPLGCYILAPFDYLNKGMWLKAIVYTFIGFCTCFLGFALFANTACDYYRYIVKGKQW